MQGSNYNFRLIWRLLNIVSDQLEDHKFLPGEVHLQAIKKGIGLFEVSTSSRYNADGIIINNRTNCEVALLETSGPFGLHDINRKIKDYIKASYGLLAMLHTIGRRCCYTCCRTLTDCS